MKNIYKFMAMVIFSSSMAIQSAEFESNVAIANDYVWRGHDTNI